MARLILILLAALALRGQTTQLLTSFESDEELRLVVPRDTSWALVEQGATEGSRALLIRFNTVRWPALFIRPAAFWDLRAWGEIVADVTNPEDEPINFLVRVDDDFRADGTRYCRTGSGSVRPGETRTFSFPLGARDPMSYGMRGLPSWPGSKSLGSNGSWTLDFSHIVQFQFFLSSPERQRTLIVDNIRWRTSWPLDGIVDAYGQYSGETWLGKLESEDEFAARRESEELQLNGSAEVPARDAWGGWAEGPRLEATGFFRAAKVEGKWWLVTPDGTLFFSSGIDCVRAPSPTFITGRESMFSWLPGAGDPLEKHYGRATSSQGPVADGRTFDFHLANLHRKYGSDYQESWISTALRRLKSWGFNTIANWSDTATYSRGVPYVTTTHYSTNATWIQIGSSGMADPFDPRFVQSVRAALLNTLRPALGDPWCLGHFVDNEMPWGNSGSDTSMYQVALAVLNRKGAGFAARDELMRQLEARYGTIGALNAAWGVNAESWAALTAPGSLNSASRRDLAEFTCAFARQYFRTVRDLIREIDPDHLYLGSRFHIYTPEVLEAAAEFADVISFNIYQTRIDPERWRFLEELDKPAIIGEFHFGALDRGMFHTGLVAAADQEDRARMFREYVESALDHPSFTGAHWFQYSDQPLTGRTLDGENYNIGFVTVTDTPYPEMVRAARELHTTMYERRARR